MCQAEDKEVTKTAGVSSPRDSKNEEMSCRHGKNVVPVMTGTVTTDVMRQHGLGLEQGFPAAALLVFWARQFLAVEAVLSFVGC